MNLSFLKKFPKLYQFAINQLTYLGDKAYSINVNAGSLNEAPDFSRVIIVARKHYEEFKQTYSSVSKKEVENIVKLQKTTLDTYPEITSITANSQQDGYDVKRIKFSHALLALVPNDSILIPETELYMLSEKEHRVIEANTPAGTLFVARFNGKLNSAYKKGIITNAETFTLSAGLPNDCSLIKVDEKSFVAFVLDKLFAADLAKIAKTLSFNSAHFINVNKLHVTYWAPILSAFVFLAAVNSYYAIKMSSVQTQLDDYGEQVNELLTMKQRQDVQADYLVAINKEINNSQLIHQEWDIIYEASKQGMYIQQFRKQNEDIHMRGRAKDASKILKALNELEQVSSAVFDGVVRKSRGEDMFVIKLALVEKNS